MRGAPETSFLPRTMCRHPEISGLAGIPELLADDHLQAADVVQDPLQLLPGDVLELDLLEQLEDLVLDLGADPLDLGDGGFLAREAAQLRPPA